MDLGQDVTEFKEEQTPNPKRSFFRYEFEKCTLDFLPELKASLKSRSSFSKRKEKIKQYLAGKKFHTLFNCFFKTLLCTTMACNFQQITFISFKKN